MNNLLLIVGSACLSLAFIETGIPFRVKKLFKVKRLKPFDCPLCLAWWLGISSSIFFEKNTLEVIYIGAAASVTAVIINKWIDT
ncbi:hypothetical protein [Chitinophaga sp.]|uniref:hypothetical protein n=1 Tax=Chitinophaga sp. TaxID=1869181 RepID=UPI0031E396E1